MRAGLALTAAVAFAALGPGTAHAGQAARSVTFDKDIAPIVFARCGICHRPGGLAPFSLLTYAAVKQRATQVAAVTARRLMPPWKAEPGYGGEFIGQHPLTDDEIGLFQRWVDEGAQEGAARDLPPMPYWSDGWQLGTPDEIVTLSQPYVLKQDGGDVLRIFVIPVPLGSRRYVKGLEFRPGNSRAVHHANIRVDPTPRSRQLDEQDPAPGYDGLMANSAVYPDGHFLAWTPGQVAPMLPKGLAWSIEPGTDLVVEMHLQPTGKPELVQPSFGIFFTDDPPERTPAMLRIGRQNIDIPAGLKEYTIADAYVLPVDVQVQAVQPHAHYRAREIRGIATLPDGTTKWLIYIKDWDFRWQHVYRYAAPVALPKGTTLSMRYTYDNSADNPRNPRRPAERALWGQQSSDEMGDLWVQVLTRDDRDLAILNRAFRVKAAAEDTAGYGMMIRRDPTNVAYHNDVALLYLELGRPTDAVDHFRIAAELQKESAPAHFNLGTALTRAGRFDEATAEYQTALQLSPDYAAAHTNLGNLLLSQERLDDAMRHYREALRLDAHSAVAHNNLGLALARLEQTSEALQRFREAIEMDARYAEPHYNMGRVFQDLGQLGDARDHLRRAVQLRPDWVPALTDLARLLATAPDDTLRAPGEAVRLAERAAILTSRQDAGVLDALGAAYASQGQFDRAIEAAESALGLDPDGLGAPAIRARVERYRQHQR